MKCPKCESKTYVIDVRETAKEKRRRRECMDCGHRFTTYETISGQSAYDDGWNDAIQMITEFGERRKV